ncbi:uncharacterized protein LOC117902340 [Drosophila subobscura]|uniref:uncharacterized protein LOC117902340 n=1 Tax=Drosophila subobscura TaxID=7241 RepID=UPI00155A0C9E|nr:uncharacterized protein LOC117902340 [Drosophila subobscura]
MNFPNGTQKTFCSRRRGSKKSGTFPTALERLTESMMRQKHHQIAGTAFIITKASTRLCSWRSATPSIGSPIYIDVGAYGSEGDMNAFSNCSFGKALLSETVQFPEDNMINGERTAYFIVGDDAFPLAKRIMKPFGSRHLAVDERIFNYRLSRARRCIENAFGILCARWMGVQRTLLSRPDKSQKVVAACCSLHNFLMRTSPNTYNINPDSFIQTHTVLTDLHPCCRGRPQDYCKAIRNNLKLFFNSPACVLAK